MCRWVTGENTGFGGDVIEADVVRFAGDGFDGLDGVGQSHFGDRTGLQESIVITATVTQAAAGAIESKERNDDKIDA